MDKRKIASLALSGVLATAMLSGCSNNDNDQQRKLLAEEKNSPTLEQVADAQLQKKIYLPYEHVFFKRYYSSKNVYAERVLGGQVEIPEGYEILEIENFNEKYGYGSQTGGFDIWFINKDTVEVTPVYNQILEIYDYSEPGSVVDMSLQEEGPGLAKIRK